MNLTELNRLIETAFTIPTPNWLLEVEDWCFQHKVDMSRIQKDMNNAKFFQGSEPGRVAVGNIVAFLRMYLKKATEFGETYTEPLGNLENELSLKWVQVCAMLNFSEMSKEELKLFEETSGLIEQIVSNPGDSRQHTWFTKFMNNGMISTPVSQATL